MVTYIQVLIIFVISTIHNFWIWWSTSTQHPSGHTMNLRRRHDVVDSSQDSSQRRRRFVIMLHPYDVAGRRIYDKTVTSQRRRSDVADSSKFVAVTLQFRRNYVAATSLRRRRFVVDWSKFVAATLLFRRRFVFLRRRMDVTLRRICDVAATSNYDESTT